VTSYHDLRRMVAAMQQELEVAGIRPDDRIALISANDPAFVVGYLAVLGAGAVVVPLNIQSPPAELERQLAQVSVAAILVGPGGRHVTAALESPAATPVLTVQVTPPQTDPEPAAPAREAVDRGPDDLAALMFTAGTAGAPRAAMLTHGNLLANLDQVQRHPGRALQASDRALAVLPLCHIFGLNAVLGGALYVGASVLLLDRFDAARTLDLIAEHRVTILVGAPSLFAALAAAPGRDDDGALGSVRFAFSGAAPLSPEIAHAWQKRFGLALRQGYGLTEAAPVVTTAVMDEPARPGSIGIPLPGVEVRLVDDEGDDALAGDPGEIWVRGANVFPGYWDDPGASSAALTPDGWLRTGDIAAVGDDGELAIVDRAKDLIIVSGFNVYPAEVEDAIAEHPGVAEVAVVGESDPAKGETVHAFVVTRAGQSVTAADVIAWCRVRLARYKCPSEVTFVPSLPHGVAGKLLRRSLRKPT
jgi:long-chain acyl-CoA synthetase